MSFCWSGCFLVLNDMMLLGAGAGAGAGGGEGGVALSTFNTTTEVRPLSKAPILLLIITNIILNITYCFLLKVCAVHPQSVSLYILFKLFLT